MTTCCDSSFTVLQEGKKRDSWDKETQVNRRGQGNLIQVEKGWMLNSSKTIKKEKSISDSSSLASTIPLFLRRRAHNFLWHQEDFLQHTSAKLWEYTICSCRQVLFIVYSEHVWKLLCCFAACVADGWAKAVATALSGKRVIHLLYYYKLLLSNGDSLLIFGLY